MNEEEINTIEEEDEYLETLESVPEEVRKFLWSDAFTTIVKAISSAHRLTPDQEVVLRDVAIKTLIGDTTPIARRSELGDAGISGDLQESILDAINEELISRAIFQVEEYKNLNIDENPTREQGISAPSPAQALANIKERLTKPSTVAPITRDYSVTRSPDSSLPKVDPSTRAPSMDIYREIPEK